MIVTVSSQKAGDDDFDSPEKTGYLNTKDLIPLPNRPAYYGTSTQYVQTLKDEVLQRWTDKEDVWR